MQAKSVVLEFVPGGAGAKVINEMNTEIHSWMVSFESFKIVAFSGNACFIIGAMFAIGR